MAEREYIIMSNVHHISPSGSNNPAENYIRQKEYITIEVTNVNAERTEVSFFKLSKVNDNIGVLT